jgi:hypothetical protein
MSCARALYPFRHCEKTAVDPLDIVRTPPGSVGDDRSVFGFALAVAVVSAAGAWCTVRPGM